MPLGAFRLNSLARRFAAGGGTAPSRVPKTINLYGNANYSTAQKKIGAGSLSLDGNGDYIDIPYATDIGKWNASTGYTLEYWVRLNSLSGTSYPDGATHELPSSYGNHAATNNVNYWSFGPVDNGNVVFFYYNGGKVTTQTSGVTLSTNTWYHLAFVYDAGGNSYKIYVDGTERASATVSGTPQFSASYPITLGAAGSTTQYMNAYIDELRVSTTARYTSNFTPSTAAFENDADTVLLVHADSDVTDDGNFTYQATGGTMSLETINGTDYILHTFTSGGTFTPLATMNVDALIIGGGGGGGYAQPSFTSIDTAGGGGGAGQVRYQSSINVSATGYTITVGAGGGTAANGSSTTAFGYTSNGGGGGGYMFGTTPYNGNSVTGGSGGGGAISSGTSVKSGGTGTYNGGASGGYGTNSFEAGGGGGSAGNGEIGSNGLGTGGHGGLGSDYSTYFGTNVGVNGYFAGGGGGGAASKDNLVALTDQLGEAGGGNGARRGTNGASNGSAGTANTGSGGGGGATEDSTSSGNGGNGGSGVVIIRYPA